MSKTEIQKAYSRLKARVTKENNQSEARIAAEKQRIIQVYRDKYGDNRRISVWLKDKWLSWCLYGERVRCPVCQGKGEIHIADPQEIITGKKYYEKCYECRGERYLYLLCVDNEPKDSHDETDNGCY